MLRFKLAILGALCGASLAIGMIMGPSSHPLETVSSPHGFAQGTVHRREVEEAIEIANEVLLDANRLALKPAWCMASRRREGEVVVYLVDGSGLAPSNLCFVPPGEKIVIVNDRHIADVYTLIGRESPGETKPELRDVLAIMLLHEVGHIVDGDTGSFAPPSRTAGTDLNAMENEPKDRELRADRFAALQIRTTLSLFARPESGEFSRYMDAARLQMAVGAISYDLMARRLVDHFGATEFYDPVVFYDHGYTHPNMELRFMYIDSVIGPDPVKERRIREFLRARSPQPQFHLLDPD